VAIAHHGHDVAGSGGLPEAASAEVLLQLVGESPDVPCDHEAEGPMKENPTLDAVMKSINALPSDHLKMRAEKLVKAGTSSTAITALYKTSLGRLRTGFGQVHEFWHTLQEFAQKAGPAQASGCGAETTTTTTPAQGSGCHQGEALAQQEAEGEKKDDVQPKAEEKNDNLPDEEKKNDELPEAEQKKDELPDAEEKKDEPADVEKKEDEVPAGGKKEDEVPDEEKKEDEVPDGEKKEESLDGEKKEDEVPDGEKKEE